jgi:hypothetical protein
VFDFHSIIGAQHFLKKSLKFAQQLSFFSFFLKTQSVNDRLGKVLMVDSGKVFMVDLRKVLMADLRKVLMVN